MRATKIYKGKISLFKEKILFSLLALIMIGLGFIFDFIPLFVFWGALITDIVLTLDYSTKERLNSVEIHLNDNQVVYNKHFVFGLICITRVFSFTDELQLNKILDYYKEDKTFSISAIDDLIGNKVVFSHN